MRSSRVSVHCLLCPRNTVEVAVPVPETRTILGPPAPVDISTLVPYFQRQIDAPSAFRTTATPFAGSREALLAPLDQARQQVLALVSDTQADLEVLYESVASRSAQCAPAGVSPLQRGRRPPLSPDTAPYSTHGASGGALGALARINDILTPDLID